MTGKDWTVVSSFKGGCTLTTPLTLAVFKSLLDALEYAAWVTEYDEDFYKGWLTYVIEGDFIHLNPDLKKQVV